MSAVVVGILAQVVPERAAGRRASRAIGNASGDAAAPACPSAFRDGRVRRATPCSRAGRATFGIRSGREQPGCDQHSQND